MQRYFGAAPAGKRISLETKKIRQDLNLQEVHQKRKVVEWWM